MALPRVASNVYIECTKCDRGGSYCRVVAHTSPTSCKLECEICKKSRRLKIEDPNAAPKAPRAVKTGVGVKKSTRGAAAAAAKAQAYQDLVGRYGSKSVAYNLREQFSKNAAIDHPTFGLGFVVESGAQKISVMFSDQMRDLVHNRKV